MGESVALERREEERRGMGKGRTYRVPPRARARREVPPGRVPLGVGDGVVVRYYFEEYGILLQGPL